MNEDQEITTGRITVVHMQTTSDGKNRITSRKLLGAQDELVIVHGNEEYRLRRTRQGKLILTK